MFVVRRTQLTWTTVLWQFRERIAGVGIYLCRAAVTKVIVELDTDSGGNELGECQDFGGGATEV